MLLAESNQSSVCLSARMSKEAEAEFKGLSKFFNTTTFTGRANIAKATYAGMAVLGLYLWLKPKPAATAGKK